MSDRDIAMPGNGREMERSKSGIKYVRVRLRIAFPYWVMAHVAFLVPSKGLVATSRSCIGLSTPRLI